MLRHRLFLAGWLSFALVGLASPPASALNGSGTTTPAQGTTPRFTHVQPTGAAARTGTTTARKSVLRDAVPADHPHAARIGEVLQHLDGPDAWARKIFAQGLLSVEGAPQASPHKDVMGAHVVGDGTTFRVWAPNADEVYAVALDKPRNGRWVTKQLASEEGGKLSTHIPGIPHASRYFFAIRRGNTWMIRGDVEANQVTSDRRYSVVYDHNRFDWTGDRALRVKPNEQIIYQLHVGTFNADVGKNGTWKTLAAKLQYIKDMGFTTIEMLPQAAFGGRFKPGESNTWYKGWGYSTDTPGAPDPRYGHPDEFKAMVKQAHGLGLEVLGEGVHNHWGGQGGEPWQYDGQVPGAEANNGGIYFYPDEKRRESGWGPRPDFGREEVRGTIHRANGKFTAKDGYRLNGLRWDMTGAIRYTQDGDEIPDGARLLSEASQHAKKDGVAHNYIAEEFRGEGGQEWITRPVRKGGAGFGAYWDDKYFHPLRDTVFEADDAKRSMESVAKAIKSWAGHSPFQRVIYPASHDESANGQRRLAEMVQPGKADGYFAKKKALLMWSVTATTPGRPMLFAGDEFGMYGHFTSEQPLDWAYAAHQGGLQNGVRDINRLRGNAFKNTRGLQGKNVNVHHINDNDKVVAYHRWDKGGPGDDVIVIANFSNKSFSNYDIGLPRGGKWRVRYNSDAQAYSKDFGNTPSLDIESQTGGKDKMAQHGGIALGPYSVVVLSQDK